MSFYTVLLAISVFMMALVLFIIQQTFFRWKSERKEESQTVYLVHHPAVAMLVTVERCILRKHTVDGDMVVYDTVSRSSLSLQSNSLHSIDNRDDSKVLLCPRHVSTSVTELSTSTPVKIERSYSADTISIHRSPNKLSHTDTRSADKLYHGELLRSNTQSKD